MFYHIHNVDIHALLYMNAFLLLYCRHLELFILATYLNLVPKGTPFRPPSCQTPGHFHLLRPICSRGLSESPVRAEVLLARSR